MKYFSLVSKIQRNKSGFSLIEMMVFMLIFTLTAIFFYRSFVSGTKAMSNAKSRLDALAIANQKMEVIHNLEYPNIGTQGGFVPGDLPQLEVVNQDNRIFWVHTSVLNVDDSFDGTAELGTDSKPNDYKQIKIQVYWEDDNPAKLVTLVSNITPPGVESIYTGGILSIHIVDNSGNPVEGANLHITNSSISPAVDMNNVTTDENGNFLLIGASAASQSYHVSVTKNGYYPVQTYAPYPTSTVFPFDVNASVVEGNINEKTIVTDLVSSIKIYTKNPLGEIIPNADFSLTGGRLIATNSPTDSTPIFSYNEGTLNTNDQGEKDFSQMSSGPYKFTLGSTISNNYEFLHISQASNSINTFNVQAGASVEETAVLANKEMDSLLVTVTDGIDSSPIANASVELKDPNSEYDVILQTDKFGQVYFPDDLGRPLNNTTYQLKVSANGYSDSTPKEVNINKLTKENIGLTAI